jgi:hypothetical protein
MLNEDKSGRDGDVGRKMSDNRWPLAPDNIGIEQSLKIIIRMVMNVLRQENGINVW